MTQHGSRSAIQASAGRSTPPRALLFSRFADTGALFEHVSLMARSVQKACRPGKHSWSENGGASRGKKSEVRHAATVKITNVFQFLAAMSDTILTITSVDAAGRALIRIHR